MLADALRVGILTRADGVEDVALGQQPWAVRLGVEHDVVEVIRLVRAYLNSGIMSNGVVLEREEGTPQGGPLSPLLANVMLDEVDKELERRGYSFARYADDCNVYVGSWKSGERVMALLRRLYARLRLTVNEIKSAVVSAFGRKFLGFELWAAPQGVVKRGVASKPMATFKQRIRQLTRRSGGRSWARLSAPWSTSRLQAAPGRRACSLSAARSAPARRPASARGGAVRGDASALAGALAARSREPLRGRSHALDAQVARRLSRVRARGEGRTLH